MATTTTGPTPPAPPAAHVPTGLLGDPPEFKGKRTNARTFIDNLEIYFALNPARITTDNQKVLLALSKISDGAEQWKRNKVTAFNTDITKWHDWDGFKTMFFSNWGEVDTSGTAYSQLVKLQYRKNKRGKKKMKLSDYVEKFKELIMKCDISGSAALHMFTNGLTTEECKDCMMQKPKDLDAFYDAAINLENIETRTNILNPSFGSGSRSEWDIQVDRLTTQINAMTIPE